MNYSNFIVKIIEEPIQHCFKEDIFVTEMLVKFSQIREKKPMRTFRIFIWGNLGHDVLKYYKMNDYIIIEGYISLYRDFSENNGLSINNQVQISVRKIYPFP